MFLSRCPFDQLETTDDDNIHVCVRERPSLLACDETDLLRVGPPQDFEWISTFSFGPSEANHLQRNLLVSNELHYINIVIRV